MAKMRSGYELRKRTNKYPNAHTATELIDLHKSKEKQQQQQKSIIRKVESRELHIITIFLIFASFFLEFFRLILFFCCCDLPLIIFRLRLRF